MGERDVCPREAAAQARTWLVNWFAVRADWYVLRGVLSSSRRKHDPRRNHADGLTAESMARPVVA
jgi:hypothetical protein